MLTKIQICIFGWLCNKKNSPSEGVYPNNQNFCWLKFHVKARYLYIRCIWFQSPLQNLALIHNKRNTRRTHNQVQVKCRSEIVPKIANTLVSQEYCNSFTCSSIWSIWYFADKVCLSFLFAFDFIRTPGIVKCNNPLKLNPFGLV